MKNSGQGTQTPETQTGNSEVSATPNTISGEALLTFTAKREQAGSKKNPEMRSLCRFDLGCIAAKMSADELFIESQIPTSRYKRGNVLKSLRIVHRMFPKATRLNLIAGIWVLCPACGVQGCTRYECQDRLVCQRGTP